MTLNDDNSVYVGGLPYDCSEPDLKHAFLEFGAVIDVKIINDRQIGGRCYGFVTFANPRSAVQAIDGMNGKKIGGRVIRVNDVRSRGARPNFHQENVNRDTWRDNDFERGRDRGKDNIHNSDLYRDRNYDRSRGRDREREFGNEDDYDREREFGNEDDYDRDRDHDEERTRDLDRDWERDHDVDWEHDTDVERTKDRDNDGEMNKEIQSRKRLKIVDSMPHSSDGKYEVKEELERAMNGIEELQKKCTLLEERIEEKKLFVSELQRKSRKLDDALAASKKITSQRQLILFKLYRCILQKEDIAGRLQNAEQELQLLFDSLKAEVDFMDDNAKDGSICSKGQA